MDLTGKAALITGGTMGLGAAIAINLAHRGAETDPVAALVFCNSGPVKHLFVEGKPVVRDGHLVTLKHRPPPLRGRVGVGGVQIQ